ncbi:hypothetical protein [Micromonospora globispora]|nr:hypothetical protein [Micromonospora globispora]
MAAIHHALAESRRESARIELALHLAVPTGQALGYSTHAFGSSST